MNSERQLYEENVRLRAENERLSAELLALRDARDEELVDAGIFAFKHPLEDSVAYSERLATLRDEIKRAVREGTAIETSPGFIYDNSLAKGKKMTADLAKLMLRAYNAEAENCVRTVKAGNLPQSLARLDRSAQSVAKLGAMMDMRVSDHFHELRRNELELTAEYLVRRAEEKEEEREQRARLREEQRAQRELLAEREKLEKERQHYENSIARLVESGTADPVELKELRRRRAELDEAIQTNDFRIANIRAGYVYVISNLGAFGPGVVKIGLTRRLDPVERVRELSSASVPFVFDVHALFFSDDAVGVEAELHRRFAARRVNRINHRREFFFASPGEVRDELVRIAGNLLEFTEEPEAEQFRMSQIAWEPESPTKR